MQKNTLKFMPVSDVCDSKSVQKISLFSFFYLIPMIGIGQWCGGWVKQSKLR